jgi:8-oxo-dGTP pyrophosphatase MutT (NUDIX family)
LRSGKFDWNRPWRRLRTKGLQLLYRLFPIYGKLHGCVAILRDQHRVLVIDRSDGLGLCLPGGLIRKAESDPDGLRREVLEETGLKMNACRLLFEYAETGGFSSFTCVYEAAATGFLRGSSEGVPRWVSIAELRTNLYRPQLPVLEFLERT